MRSRILPFLFFTALFGGLAWALLSLPVRSDGLKSAALESLERSGVDNPVTAVLLNYRAYDTLLELAVLLLAITGVWTMRSARAAAFNPTAGPMLGALLRFLLPLLFLVAGYLLWIGAFAPGGAFQGGALLGGAIVLMMMGGVVGRFAAAHLTLIRIGLAAGLAVFIAVGLGSMIPGARLIEYPGASAGSLILLIESAALVSIGMTLGALYFGGRPVAGDEIGDVEIDDVEVADDIRSSGTQ
jgi:multisubunit Na+/H+ antiporter MnhB subunit